MQPETNKRFARAYSFEQSSNEGKSLLRRCSIKPTPFDCAALLFRRFRFFSLHVVPRVAETDGFLIFHETPKIRRQRQPPSGLKERHRKQE